MFNNSSFIDVYFHKLRSIQWMFLKFNDSEYIVEL